MRREGADMAEDFKAALTRVQSDYSFYIRCQTDPEGALAGYALSPDERAVLADQDKLTEALAGRGDIGIPKGISITISGTHDWVNRTAPDKPTESEDLVAQELESIQQATSDDERREATLRLMQLLG